MFEQDQVFFYYFLFLHLFRILALNSHRTGTKIATDGINVII